MKRLSLILLTVLTACSSAPPPPDHVVDRKNRAADYTNFGNNYYQQANFDQALTFFQLALETNTAVDNEEGAALSYNSIGKTLFALGRTAEAEAAYNEAYQISRKLKLTTLIYQSVNNLGEILLRKGKNDEAIKLFDDTLGAVNQADTSKELAILYHGIGVVQRKKALEASPADPTRLNQALASFQRALDINTKLTLKQEMASNLFMQALTWMDLSAWDKASLAATAALDNDRLMENSLGIGLDLRLLARINLQLGQKAEAWDQLLRSYKVFTAISQKDQQQRTLELIVPLSQDLKKTDELVYYQKLLDKFHVQN